jgi:hypothetical protein
MPQFDWQVNPDNYRFFMVRDIEISSLGSNLRRLVSLLDPDLPIILLRDRKSIGSLFRDVEFEGVSDESRQEISEDVNAVDKWIVANHQWHLAFNQQIRPIPFMTDEEKEALLEEISPQHAAALTGF